MHGAQQSPLVLAEPTCKQIESKRGSNSIKRIYISLKLNLPSLRPPGELGYRLAA